MSGSLRSLGLTLTVAALASACATAPTQVTVTAPAPAAHPPAPPTLEGQWALAMLRDAPANARVTAPLKIQAGHAEGATDCRAWSASAPNSGMDLRLEALSDQPQSCEGAVKAIEEKYVSALKDVRMVQMRSGYLIMIDQNGRERLYFTRG